MESEVDANEVTDLLARCAQGDARAWSEVVDRYGRLVYSVPRRYRFSDADSDDIFQSVFETLLRSVGQIKDARSLPAWLLTTTHRACWRHRRASAASAATDDAMVLAAEPPVDLMARWERQHLVHDGLRQLGGMCERLLRMLFLVPVNPNYDVVAESTGLAPGSIGPMRRRCLRKLAGVLAESGDLDGFGEFAETPAR